MFIDSWTGRIWECYSIAAFFNFGWDYSNNLGQIWLVSNHRTTIGFYSIFQGDWKGAETLFDPGLLRLRRYET
jgi:hypothetical protein